MIKKIREIKEIIEKILETNDINYTDSVNTNNSIIFIFKTKFISFTFIFKVDKVIVRTILYINFSKASIYKEIYEIPCNNKEWTELIEDSLERAVDNLPEHQKNLLKK